MAKILIVDDDSALATIIVGFLEAKNHIVEAVHTVRSAEDILAISHFEAIILDVGLPDQSGAEFCQQLRMRGVTTPIIMLTGKSTVSDKTLGLDLGADDYLTKPFSLDELSSRINALIRRSATKYSITLKSGDIELDPITHSVTKAGQPVHLLPQDFALLEFFMRHPGTVFSKEALISWVWPSETEAADDAIRSAIKRLRQKLDDSEDAEQSIIETQRRVGYRFVGRK